MKVKRLIYIIGIVLGMMVMSADGYGLGDEGLDSLIRLYNAAGSDTARLRLLDAISIEHYNVDSTRQYATRLLELSRRMNAARYEGRALRYLGWVEYYKSDYDSCLAYHYKALAIMDSLRDSIEIARNIYSLANAYSMEMDMELANENYLKSIDMFRRMGQRNKVTDAVLNFCQANIEFGLYDTVEGLIEEQVRETDECTEFHCDALHMVGELNYCKYIDTYRMHPDLETLSRARRNYEEAYSEGRKIDYKLGVCRSSQMCISCLYMETRARGADWDGRAESVRLAKEIYVDYERVMKELNYETEMWDLRAGEAKIEIMEGNDARAKELCDSLNEALDQSLQENAYRLRVIYGMKADLAEDMGDYTMAMRMVGAEAYWMQKQRCVEMRVTTAQSAAQAEYNEKLRQREEEERTRTMEYEARARQHEVLMWAAGVVIVMLMVLGLSILRASMKSERMNKVLEQKNEEIVRANREMTDSINYASVIQRAVLPSAEYMDRVVGENFVIYHPLNIVSGDYYWASAIGGYTLIAVADSTGHGVPGGFLSMLGMSILDNVAGTCISERRADAGYVLTQMRAKLMSELHQTDREGTNQDGMDVAMLVIDRRMQVLHYAGAMRPMLFMRGGEIRRVAPDKMPIGIHYHDEQTPFRDNEIALEPGDQIYLFSDGLTDQFGYDASTGRTRKFGLRRLTELLESKADKSMAEQGSAIESEFMKWKTDEEGFPLEQTDDVTIVGIRV